MIAAAARWWGPDWFRHPLYRTPDRIVPWRIFVASLPLMRALEAREQLARVTASAFMHQVDPTAAVRRLERIAYGQE